MTRVQMFEFMRGFKYHCQLRQFTRLTFKTTLHKSLCANHLNRNFREERDLHSETGNTYM